MNANDETNDKLLPLTVKERIHEKIELFIVSWQQFLNGDSGTSRPDIGGHLDGSEGDEEVALFRELLDNDLHYRRQRGEHPSRDEYESRFPHLRGIIYRAIAEYTLPDRFQIERQLGQGAFGTVFLAHDDELDRDVAVKMPRPGRDMDVFLKEARTLAKLDHPNIVPVYDVLESDEGRGSIVSKYIEGTDLAKQLEEQIPDPVDSARLVATIANALAYAHHVDRKVYHRDIKPANILIDKDGTAYLGDFGLALTEDDYGQHAVQAGTFCYMSPEQVRFESHLVDGRSDVFSLGVVFYQMLTGELPFVGTEKELEERIQKLEPKSLRELNPRVPPELERICLTALVKRKSDRYIARDMAEDLRLFLEQHEATKKRSRIEDIPPPVRPKGLRAFTKDDSDFYLSLLPGQPDREGLPPLVRFWKSRIEAKDEESTFRVGVIYGPSGCGKSSLLRAGILPRLAGHVIQVPPVDATTQDTESDLLNKLRRNPRCELPADARLEEALAHVRQAEGVVAGERF